MKTALRLVSCCGALAACFLLPACAAELSPQGAQVQVSDEQMVHTCQYLGDVNGNSSDASTARNDARNRAAAMGATNVVFIGQGRSVAGEVMPVDSMGRAYRCPTGAQPAPAAAAVPAPPAT
jgi:hypothetical protein